MGKMAYLFPGQGQGSVKVGMGKDLYWQSEQARYIFSEANVWFKKGILTSVCFYGPEAKLMKTAWSQPASLTVNLAYVAAKNDLEKQGESFAFIQKGDQPDFLAGHSVGYLAALVYAGVIDFRTAMMIVQKRADLMEKACELNPGKMIVLLNPDIVEVERICKIYGIGIGLYNSETQIVLSGKVQATEEAAREIIGCKFAKRAALLQTEGAFHSECMRPAVDPFEKFLTDIPFANPRIPIIGNSRAQIITRALEAKQELIDQLCLPVLWQQSMEALRREGVDTFIEMGEGEVISNNLKRGLIGAGVAVASFSALFAAYLFLKRSQSSKP